MTMGLRVPFPPELTLVAACCRWPRSAQRDAAVRAAAAVPLDWKRLERTIARHRVVALVQDGLRSAGVALPAPLDARLTQQARTLAFKGLIMARETVRLQQAFDAAGIPALFVKGAVLAIQSYRDLGLKQSKDIDLLTVPEQVTAARDLLRALGYHMSYPHQADDDRTFAMVVDLYKECEFLNPALGGVAVELHWRLADNRYLIPHVSAASPTQEVALAGVKVRTLHDEALFAYLCTHGASHGWERLKWLADAGAFLAGRSAEEVAHLHRAATALGAGRTSGVALLLLHRLLGQQLTPALLADLTRSRITTRLADTAMQCLAHGGGHTEITIYSSARLRIMIASLFLMEGADYARAQAALFWVYPPDRLSTPLPPALGFLYHLWRIPGALMRFTRRKVTRAGGLFRGAPE